MERITEGFKLFQPWATDVVKGKLNYLVRSISTIKLRRVAVIASNNIDVIWSANVTDKEFKEVQKKVGVIGSVEIKDCLKIKLNEVKTELIKLAGDKYWNYYPKHLISKYTRTGMVYIWVLDNAKEWEMATEIKSSGITWARVDLEEK